MGYFAFHVSVRDTFGHVDKATVQIYLLREDQRIRFVFRSHPAEIRARMLRFREVLGKVTSSIVNVDHYIVHEDDHTKTDVLFHFVNPGDNSVMEVGNVLRMIDYKTEELDPIFKEFNVLYTEGVDPTYIKVLKRAFYAPFTLLLRYFTLLFKKRMFVLYFCIQYFGILIFACDLFSTSF